MGGSGVINQQPAMAAQRCCCVNRVLCHHLKQRGPLAGKTQNQLSSTVFSLNFPPLCHHFCTSSAFLRLDQSWNATVSCLMKTISEHRRDLFSFQSRFSKSAQSSITSDSPIRTTRQHRVAAQSCMEIMNMWNRSKSHLSKETKHSS